MQFPPDDIRRVARWSSIVLALALAIAPAVFAQARAETKQVAAQNLSLPDPSDIFKTDAPVNPITLADGRSAIYERYWIEQSTRTARQALWRVDDAGAAHPLEPGEPDGFSPILSPDGKW